MDYYNRIIGVVCSLVHRIVGSSYVALLMAWLNSLNNGGPWQTIHRYLATNESLFLPTMLIDGVFHLEPTAIHMCKMINRFVYEVHTAVDQLTSPTVGARSPTDFGNSCDS